jgi:hypothetical protein
MVPASTDHPRLRFWHWFSMNNGPDYGEVQIWTSTYTNTLSRRYQGTGGGVWSRTSFDLSAYAGQTVQLAFFFHAQDDSSASPETSAGWYIDEVAVVTGLPMAPNSEDFELGLGDWFVDGGTWEVGRPTSGPGRAHSGVNAAATVLAGNSLDRIGSSEYNGVDSRLISPPFLVPAASGNPRLDFTYWFSFNVGPDYGRVEIRVGTNAWQRLSPGDYTGSSFGQWVRESIPISSYAGQTVQVAFFFHAQDDSSASPETGAGWYIDDVCIERAV